MVDKFLGNYYCVANAQFDLNTLLGIEYSPSICKMFLRFEQAMVNINTNIKQNQTNIEYYIR